ncbi:MAG: CDP-diacylglycerol--serine O-phosphatidyltransferase [Nitrospirae bacterium GWD2_57_9]|nr:MAG: CDP-diacylglycerol--serine O-phosphatidyltransferase [Nitrospirae bacterium GWD2_57_9]OGW47316.1 MAG: CDP-diacylglycerol--serine O-phosphatidyltransferase [Nitrospirae bacterium GWC2_57_9]
MRKGIYVLPSLLTLMSMFLGFYSIVRSFNSDYELASWSILAAAIFDVLDGWVARLTHTATRFGIEIDSLSDVISFGVAPGFLIYTWTLQSFGKIGWLGSFFLVACAALRLARFNVQMGSTEKKHFTGLPTPAAALAIATTVVAYEEIIQILEQIGLIGMANVIRLDYWVLVLTFLLAGLMVSNITYHSLKEANLSQRRPFGILVAIAAFLAIVAYHPSLVLFLVAISYVASGLIEALYHLLKKPREVSA